LKRIGIALVGCGGIMDSHVNGYRDLHDRGLAVFDIKATCDTLEQNARDKAEAVGAFQGTKPKAYTDLEDMLRNEGLDAVDIALPHNLHHTIACRCLEADLHVIIEKPLAITMRAAKIIMSERERRGKTLAVAENYRRSPESRGVWWAMRKGLIGEFRMISWASAGWGPRAWGWREDRYVAGGSWVLDGGVHLSDLDRYHLGREAIDVYAVQDTFDPIKDGVKVTVDDMTMAVIRFEGRSYVQWLWTRAAPGKSMGHRTIYGSKGSLSDEGLTVQGEGSVDVYSMEALVDMMMEELSAEERGRMFPKGAADTFSTELYDFYDSIANRRRPEVDAVEGYRDMAIPTGFYESTVAEGPVRVRDVEDLRVEEYQRDINLKLGIE
jgi:predicted dehydrogenase